MAKIWLGSFEVENNHGYNQPELNRLIRLTRQNQTRLLGYGMSTLADELATQVRTVGIRFADNKLFVSLDDQRVVSVPLYGITWLRWLANATLAQRAKWSIEPGGFAIYWEELDDGIEVSHLLGMQPMT